ncbi:PLDc N-terminal domain-containing protein [Georgenia sp. MJ206]|uniref:PLD nuclease N-terminal domain-containing protein n=1 Tax=Georgenia wangjunii TaxID=3117730 RepID=UPI002F2602F8
MRYLPLVALLVLTIYALVDCVRYEDENLPSGMPKALWIVLIVIFPAAGPIAWLVVSRASRAGGATRPARPSAGPAHPSGFSTRPSRRPAGPVAPDDDPDFLANLDRARRDREREAQGPAAAPEEKPGPGEAPDEQERDRGDGTTPAGSAG